MKLWSIFLKTLREMRRDVLILVLSLICAPFFIFVYVVLFPGGSTTYGVVIMNQDPGAVRHDGTMIRAGEDIIKAIAEVRYANGNPMLKILSVADDEEAQKKLQDRDAALILNIPSDFSANLVRFMEGDKEAVAVPNVVGDLTYPFYPLAAILVNSAMQDYVNHITGTKQPLGFSETPLGGSDARSEFEMYVPGLLIFSIILLVFLSSMTVAREVENGTLRRLRLTCMSSFDYLSGVSLMMIIVGIIAITLTFASAVGMGFSSQGSLWIALIVGAVTTISVVGIGLIVACLCRTVAQAFVIANFPLMLCMFFSGVIYPIPRVPIMALGEIQIGAYDFLPSTHAVNALNKIITLGLDFDGVIYELTALIVLSALYFGIGVWLFNRTHMRSA